jgi:hypothetical protein
MNRVTWISIAALIPALVVPLSAAGCGARGREMIKNGSETPSRTADLKPTPGLETATLRVEGMT